eukprot:217946-Chlamydomonas_euryale.AAC.1
MPRSQVVGQEYEDPRELERRRRAAVVASKRRSLKVSVAVAQGGVSEAFWAVYTCPHPPERWGRRGPPGGARRSRARGSARPRRGARGRRVHPCTTTIHRAWQRPAGSAFLCGHRLVLVTGPLLWTVCRAALRSLWSVPLR